MIYFRHLKKVKLHLSQLIEDKEIIMSIVIKIISHQVILIEYFLDLLILIIKFYNKYTIV